MAKNKVSKEALNKIEFIDKNWARNEYEKLSQAARELLIQDVNSIFWQKNPEKWNTKLDPSKPEDMPYINKWLNIRNSLIARAQGSRVWENARAHRAREDEDIRRENEKIRRSSRNLGQSLDEMGYNINQPVSTPGKEEPEQVRGILREGKTGKGFLDFINETFNTSATDRVLSAFNIVSRAKNGHLINASRDPDGLKGLITLWNVLRSDPSEKKYVIQANRVLAAIGSLSANAQLGYLDQPYIFPAEFTLFNSSHITAHLTPEGNIWVKLTQHSLAGHPEGKTLGDKAFTRGIELKPYEWVRFKLYDEGGITICRPALYLLQLSDKSITETWFNILNVGFLGFPGGPFIRTGKIWREGGGKLANFLSKFEKVADHTANGFILGNIAVRENRGWIIKTFQEKGKDFLELFDLAAVISMFYLAPKAVTSPIMIKSMGKMTTTWDDMIRAITNPDDVAKLSGIEKAVNEFKKAVKEHEELNNLLKSIDEGRVLDDIAVSEARIKEMVKEYDDLVKVIPEGPELPRSVDDVAEASEVQRQIKDSSARALEPGLEYAPTQRVPLSGSTTLPPIPYSRKVLRYLGEETTEKIAKMGVDAKGLDEYIGRLNWEAAKGDRSQIYLGKVQESVKKVIVAQVEKSLTLGDELSRKLVSYGWAPDYISDAIDTLAKKGYSIRQIRESLNNETKLMDYVRDQFCGGRIDDAKLALKVAERDVRSVITQELWNHFMRNWHKNNPGLDAGHRRLLQFNEDAKQLTKDIVKNLLGSSSIGGAVIYQGSEKERDQKSKTEMKESQIPDTIKDLIKPVEKLKIRESNKKKIQESLKEKKWA